ncbi:hypothetical protein DL93DRAFT_2156379 [Clavulina sp. PMI_390]|nr:hypothetical protein DL93DRAFT_2156379 [Clavulina sp. PMI_390]
MVINWQDTSPRRGHASSRFSSTTPLSKLRARVHTHAGLEIIPCVYVDVREPLVVRELIDCTCISRHRSIEATHGTYMAALSLWPQNDDRCSSMIAARAPNNISRATASDHHVCVFGNSYSGGAEEEKVVELLGIVSLSSVSSTDAWAAFMLADVHAGWNDGGSKTVSSLRWGYTAGAMYHFIQAFGRITEPEYYNFSEYSQLTREEHTPPDLATSTNISFDSWEPS